MSSQQPAPTIVTLTREHRDAIRDHISFELDTGGDLRRDVERGDEDGARARIDRLAACLRLLDQIGWQQHGNRESYRVELDDDTARFIQRMGKVARRTLEDARRDLTVPRDPDEQATYYADVVETAWRLIDLDLDAISAAGIVRDALATSNPNH